MKELRIAIFTLSLFGGTVAQAEVVTNCQNPTGTIHLEAVPQVDGSVHVTLESQIRFSSRLL